MLGDNNVGTDEDVERGLFYAAAIPTTNSAGAAITAPRAARVLNASLGHNDPAYTGMPIASTAQLAIVKRIGTAGTIMVFAAGNDGPCNKINGWAPFRLSSR